MPRARSVSYRGSRPLDKTSLRYPKHVMCPKLRDPEDRGLKVYVKWPDEAIADGAAQGEKLGEITEILSPNLAKVRLEGSGYVAEVKRVAMRPVQDTDTFYRRGKP